MHTRTISFSFSSALCFLIFGRIEFHFENCPIITAKLKTICSMVKEIGHYLLCSLIADLSAASTSCTAVKGTVHEIYRIHKLLIALVIFVILFSSLFFFFCGLVRQLKTAAYYNIIIYTREPALPRCWWWWTLYIFAEMMLFEKWTAVRLIMFARCHLSVCWK